MYPSPPQNQQLREYLPTIDHTVSRLNLKCLNATLPVPRFKNNRKAPTVVFKNAHHYMSVRCPLRGETDSIAGLADHGPSFVFRANTDELENRKLVPL
jgi:hypothetical protein